MVMREQDKHFVWSLLAVTGMILAWESLLAMLGKVPYIKDPRVGFFVGFAILTFSGIIIRDFDPLGSLDKAVRQTVNHVHNHPKKEEFEIVYYDKLGKKKIFLPVKDIKHIERDSIVVHCKKREEAFIPLQRVTEINQNGKIYWRM
ncbi:hypothetical protein HZC30_02175 [Candidatus Woesearchaeota archaeon]|nr:hypothetical protein [Candidatus Woesearchaeota archaeon]